MSESTDLFEDEKIKRVMSGDSSLDALLTRLKQSMVSTDEYAKFVKKKAAQTEDYYSNLRKQAKHTTDHIGSNATQFRNDSFMRSFQQIVTFDDKLYSVGHSYVQALLVMSDELHSLVMAISKSRKLIKEEGKRREKECIDAILAAEKAKQKYLSFCTELEKLRTTDPNKKSFSLTNKTNAQQEDELTKKIEAADADYRSKVKVCESLKLELVNHHRPNSASKLKNLILEIDIALNVQLLKYVTWQETLVMNSGVMISPFAGGPSKKSMKEIASAVNNELDLYNYLLKFINMKPNVNLVPVVYKVHPSLERANGNYKPLPVAKPFFNPNPTPLAGSVPSSVTRSVTSGPVGSSLEGSSYKSTLDPDHKYEVTPSRPLNSVSKDPTFGIKLEEVVEKAGNDNVPLIVERCIQLIDVYGLKLDGLYRISGNATAIRQLKELVDQTPTNYLKVGEYLSLDGSSSPTDSEIHLIALLVKNFFSSLSVPLISVDLYTLLLDALKTAPDSTFVMRKFHQIVYKLADPEYFTLRYLIFHLNRVADLQDTNRMTPRNLGIIWGTTLLPSLNPNAEEMSYQGKIIEELMRIANDIFEPDT
ncbi:hypothetical protein BABINDRAFT_8743 [Babjeviella inositovora NRRL Y-12698]|uniref:Rho-GAP domain-containing protein n=1 Tax=Babjeviella inositovora NRRL Y-12698 TaxID=984486 RepID=A0A1E3QND0_9ASCO|nr:uncharacterized protein BABINDRAFT_8743 [Babjeviella inositovora NRRL Y-12698]ODQ79148.1 hypothetical protein BABINDRAFT_8743 [Babjeviella inositovora NRRL Y-12698]